MKHSAPVSIPQGWHWLVTLPALIYIIVAAFWHREGINKITGDEPHYLMITESLVRDRDLNVTNNLAADNPVTRESPPGALRDPHDVRGISIHGPGLALLLVPAYAAGGVAGARAFMALLAGVIPLMVFRLARLASLPARYSAALALVLAFGLPFLPASNQIYPDLVSGAAMFFLLIELWAWRRGLTDPPTQPRLALYGLMLGFLPWLHIKNLLPGALIGLALLAQIIWSVPPPSRRWRSLTVLGFAAAAPLVALGAHNLMAFADLLGHYDRGAVVADAWDAATVFLGLHLDRAQGLFLQSPLLLVGLVGLPLLVAADRAFVVLVAAAYLAVVVPNAVHVNQYGGYSFAGRFQWSVILFWVFPLVLVLKHLFDTKRRRLATALLGLSMMLDALVAPIVLWRDGYLLNEQPFLADNWLRPAPYADLFRLDPTAAAALLPSFRTARAAFFSPINWFAVTGTLTLLSLGLLARHGHFWKVPTFALGGVLCILLAASIVLPPRLAPLTFPGAALPSQAGAAIGDSRAATVGDTGYVTFGPFTHLRPGSYAITLVYSATGDGASWDCTVGPEMFEITRGPLLPREGATMFHRCDVPNGAPVKSSFEFRVFTPGGISVAVHKLSIRPLDKVR